MNAAQLPDVTRILFFVPYRHRRILAGLCGLLLLIGLGGHLQTVYGQDALPPCEKRPTHVDPPWVVGALWCLERVVQDDSGEELSFTSLATAPDGTLYATRPLTGEVLALTDSDGDGLPDSPQVVADGLTLPNGLAYDQNALYISGGAHIYRMIGNRLDVLVDDLPSEGGFWTGGLAVGPDKRIYVGIGAPCDYCEQNESERGAVWSFALDGSDKQVVATRLRDPSDLAFRDGVLWTVDSARDTLTEPGLDELDRVLPGANFGWPYCIGADNHRDTLASAFDCSSATAPAYTFPTHSTPLGMAYYGSDTFPGIKGDLLITMSGSTDQSHLEGYALAAVHFDPVSDVPVGDDTLIPKQARGSEMRDLQLVHYQGSGFWPHRPLDVAVNAAGWIYVSVGGGTIYALRPL
jgi:glucose/arabinose dehydrogenase